MLRNSFIFLPGVGEKTEKDLWDNGIEDWSAFLKAGRVSGLSALKKGHCDQLLLKAEKNLLHGNSAFFAHILPAGEHWRAYPAFKGDAAFIDIETSGRYGDVTVFGLYDGKETKTLVKGINLDKKVLKEELANYRMLVTFNGSGFDLPVLERFLPGVIPAVPHLDLRHACSRLGLTGGLKAIERRLGISRDVKVADMLGEDAVYLWNAWRATGNRDFLEKLVAYNEEDVVNLQPLTEFAVRKLTEGCLS